MFALRALISHTDAQTRRRADENCVVLPGLPGLLAADPGFWGAVVGAGLVSWIRVLSEASKRSLPWASKQPKSLT